MDPWLSQAHLSEPPKVVVDHQTRRGGTTRVEAIEPRTEFPIHRRSPPSVCCTCHPHFALLGPAACCKMQVCLSPSPSNACIRSTLPAYPLYEHLGTSDWLHTSDVDHCDEWNLRGLTVRCKLKRESPRYEGIVALSLRCTLFSCGDFDNVS